MTNSPTTIEPAAFTIAGFMRTYSLGRTTVNELMRTGKLATRYCGSRRLIDGNSARAWYASLPAVPAKRAAA